MPSRRQDAFPSVQKWTGDAYVFTGSPEPDIPPNKARDCPQCGRKTWALSRWCWHCRFDFDRAAIARFHPVKVLAAALWLALMGLCLMLIKLYL